MTGFAQLSGHGARRTDLPGPYGPIAALSGPGLADPVATALLVPGYTGSKEDFAPLLDGIAETGIRPVAVDLPGQYESPGPDDEACYLPSALGKVVAGLVGALAAETTTTGPVLLLGHSYGGLVARGAVLAGAPVAGLTLLGSGPGSLPPGPRREAMDTGAVLLRRDGTAAAYAAREALTVRLSGAGSPARAVPAELATFLRARFVASRPACLLGMAEGLRTEPDLVSRLGETLRERAIPSLVVAGAHDDAWSVPAQREMARRLGATFATVPDAAHSPNTENPRALLRTLLPHWHTWLGTERYGEPGPP